MEGCREQSDGRQFRKRAKIKSMNIILGQIQAKLNEKEKVLEEKVSEVELLKNQVNAQSIEINAKMMRIFNSKRSQRCKRGSRKE